MFGAMSGRPDQQALLGALRGGQVVPLVPAAAAAGGAVGRGGSVESRAAEGGQGRWSTGALRQATRRRGCRFDRQRVIRCSSTGAFLEVIRPLDTRGKQNQPSLILTSIAQHHNGRRVGYPLSVGAMSVVAF